MSKSRKSQQDNPQDNIPAFGGFDRPEQNWFKLPNDWTDLTADITSIAELKVVEYILRHTWGYQEYGIKKCITIDEFMFGRKRQDGTRMDRGTGLSKPSVISGIQAALQHGFIEEEVDDSDRARIKKYYSLKMREANVDVKKFDIGVKDFYPRGADSLHRTEKETIERNLKKDTYLSNIRKAESDEKNLGNPRSLGETPVGTTPSMQESVEHSNNGRSDKNAAAAPLQTSGQTQTQSAEELEAIEKYRRSAAKLSGNNPPSSPEEPERRGGLTHIGQTLQGRLPVVPSAVDDTVAREAIERYIRDIAVKLHDEAPLKSSTTRAFNLYRQAGADLNAFFNLLYDAEKEANRRSATIKKLTSLGFKNRMAYFFAVLEDKLGLREKPLLNGPQSP